MIHPFSSSPRRPAANKRSVRIPCPGVEMLEARELLSTASAVVSGIHTNDVLGQDHTLFLYNPPSTGEPVTQKIPVPVQNHDLKNPEVVQLSVLPASSGTFSTTTVSLGPGASTLVTFTPTADSPMPNGTRIFETINNSTTIEYDYTIVSVTFGPKQGVTSPHVKNADTPAGMPDRIPPRVGTTEYVTVTPDLTGSGQSVSLAVIGQNAQNGIVTINGKTTPLTITSSGPITLTSPDGSTQTSPGHAGNLALAVKILGTNALKSKGFSVAAIPVDFSSSNPRIYNLTSDSVGMIVDWGLKSDSGDPRDLDQVEVSEVVSVKQDTNYALYLLRLISGGVTSGYKSAVDIAKGSYIDRHTITKWNAYVISNETIIFDQAFEFKDARTGATDVSMPNSGFMITQAIRFNNKAHKITLTTTKSAVPVTIGRIRTGPGFTFPTTHLTVTQTVK